MSAEKVCVWFSKELADKLLEEWSPAVEVKLVEEADGGYVLWARNPEQPIAYGNRDDDAEEFEDVTKRPADAPKAVKHADDDYAVDTTRLGAGVSSLRGGTRKRPRVTED